MKKKGQDFDFATKTQKIGRIKFDESTSRRFIVPVNKDGVGFRWKSYDEQILGAVVDRQTFDNTITEATKICRNLFRLKQMEEKKDFTKDYQPLLIVSVLLIILAFIILLILLYGTNEMALLYVAVVLICLAAFLTFIVVGKIWTLSPIFMNLDQITMIKLTEYFNQQNLKYEQLGYRWVLEENLYWVELQQI